MVGGQPCVPPWPELSGWPGTVCNIPRCRSELLLSESLQSFLHPTAAQKSGSGSGGKQRSDFPDSRCWLSCSCSAPCKTGRPHRSRRPAGWSSRAPGRTSQSLRPRERGKRTWPHGPEPSRCSPEPSRWPRSESGGTSGGTPPAADSHATSGISLYPGCPESKSPSPGRKTERSACQLLIWKHRETQEVDTVDITDNKHCGDVNERGWTQLNTGYCHNGKSWRYDVNYTWTNEVGFFQSEMELWFL